MAMMAFFKLILSMLSGYFLGSINTAILVGKSYKVDLKKQGSGNAGMTNAYRVLGAPAALMVLLGDVLKAILACFLGFVLTRNELGSGSFFDLEYANLGLMLAGTSCILGHIYPLFFKFKGGKGVLTSVVVIFLMDYRIAAICMCVFIIILLLTKYVSLGSIFAALSFPIVSLIFKKPLYFLVYAIAISILLLIMHRKNIERLIKGTESKVRIGN